MNDFYQFAGNHPLLTFFLASFAASAIVGVAKAIFHR